MPRYSSNDMVHNHYLEEAKKKTQERGRNSRPSVMPSAKSQSTTNDSKPKPRINNQNSRNWLASNSSWVTTKTVPIAEHSRNSRNFSDTKHFVCSTYQKCVFNVNHDACVTKFLNEVNSRAKVPSHKTTNRNKPVEQISIAKKPKRQIPIGHRWIPTGKIFESSTTKVDSEPPHDSNTDITNLYECIQTLDSSACTSKNVQEEQNLDLSAVIMEYLVKIRKKARILELNRRHLKISVLTSYTPYPSRKIRRTIFGVPPYPFNYPIRRLTIEEMLAKSIDDGKREHEEMEIFIKEFKTTNELLLKEQSNLLSELKIEMTYEASRGKEIKETRINKNEPPRFEQDVQE
ncbi:hypothetical protein Tco_0296559 [Tanacetum coccineum]